MNCPLLVCFFPFSILYTSIMSPLSLRSFRDVRPKTFNLSAWLYFRRCKTTSAIKWNTTLILLHHLIVCPLKTFCITERRVCCAYMTAQSVNAETCRYEDSYNVSAMSTSTRTGYISSQALTDVPAACDRADRPWVVTAQRGQRINLTLFNFTPLRPNQLKSFSPYDDERGSASHTQTGQFFYYSDVEVFHCWFH